MELIIQWISTDLIFSLFVFGGAAGVAGREKLETVLAADRLVAEGAAATVSIAR